MKIGCIIMASGMARRFGSNKLLCDFHGQPIIALIMDSVKKAGISPIVVVTRHPEVADISKSMDIPALVHTLPQRSDTVRLGIEYLLNLHPDLEGILFAAADQPCLKWESISNLLKEFQSQPEMIHRLSFQGTVGNPVLFPRWAFDALRHLPEGRGGSAIIKAHPESVRTVEATNQWELVDVDTPETLQNLLQVSQS